MWCLVLFWWEGSSLQVQYETKNLAPKNKRVWSSLRNLRSQKKSTVKNKKTSIHSLMNECWFLWRTKISDCTAHRNVNILEKSFLIYTTGGLQNITFFPKQYILMLLKFKAHTFFP